MIYEDIEEYVETNGRLSEEQEDILYNISLRQDELGREASNIFLQKLNSSPLYQKLVEREFLTYEVYNHGSKHEVASLIVTNKGLRYCIKYADEISIRRKLNPAGAPWDK